MGVYTRADSPFYQLYLEPSHRGERGRKKSTKIRVDAPTKAQRQDNLRLAEAQYHNLMHARRRGEVDVDTKPATTFAARAAWYVEHVLPTKRGKEREAPLIPKLVAVFGKFDLCDITRTLVTERWVSPRLTKPTVVARARRTAARTIQAGPRTINREVAVLKAILQSGVPDYLAESPLYGMPLLPTKTPQRRLMTEDEERRLLAVMAPDDKVLFLLGLDSLIRLTDLLDLKRSDDHGLSMWIGDPKAGGGFAVPISSRARAALDAWYKEHPMEPAAYLFARRRRAKTERDRRHGIGQMLEDACAAADPPIPFGRKAGGITFHWATRRTGLTRMLTRNVDLGTAQKIGRWKTPDVVLGVYHELIDETAHAAVNAVGTRSRGIPVGRKRRKLPKQKAS